MSVGDTESIILKANGGSPLAFGGFEEPDMVDSRPNSGDRTLSGAGTSPNGGDTTCRIDDPKSALEGDEVSFVPEVGSWGARFCWRSGLAEVKSPGGCFCSLLDCRCSPCGFPLRDSCNDSVDVLGCGDDRADSSDVFSGSSTSSSNTFPFLSFLLKRPLSIPGFLSFRLLFSPDATLLSRDSRLARPY
jgi:hypothetical protein